MNGTTYHKIQVAKDITRGQNIFTKYLHWGTAAHSCLEFCPPTLEPRHPRPNVLPCSLESQGKWSCACYSHHTHVHVHICAHMHTHTHTQDSICFDNCQCPSLPVTTCLQEVRWHLLPCTLPQSLSHKHPINGLRPEWISTNNYTCLKWSSCKGQQGAFFLSCQWEKQEWSIVSQGTSQVLTLINPNCSYCVPSLTSAHSLQISSGAVGR